MPTTIDCAIRTPISSWIGLILLLLVARAGAAADQTPPVPSVDPDAAVPSLQIGLDDALRLAFVQGRDKQTRDEDLALVAHRLRVVARDYGPRLSGDVDGEITYAEDAGRDSTASARVAVAQVLPTNGRLELSAASTRSDGEDASATYSDQLGLSLRQPLLRGAGGLVWREDLTAAERAFVYARRGYELFLHDLSLGIARNFWRLQEQQFRVESSREEVARAEFGLNQSRAFLDLGRTTANDVFRAELGLLQAQQGLVDAIGAYDVALDRFKIELNLPVDAPVEIIGEAPRLPLLDIDARLAITLAIDQRLDLRTVRDRIADSERGVRLSRNRLLPEVDLRAGVDYSAVSARAGEDLLDDDPQYSVGINLQIPFERHHERFGYATALTGLSQARREADLQESQVVRQVQAALRDLRIAEVSLRIQERNVEQSRKRLIKSQMDYEAGLISNRDLIEAQGEVRDAETAFFRARIEYRVAELQLRRDTGIMTVGAHGKWQDELPPYVTIRPGAVPRIENDLEVVPEGESE